MIARAKIILDRKQAHYIVDELFDFACENMGYTNWSASFYISLSGFEIVPKINHGDTIPDKP